MKVPFHLMIYEALHVFLLYPASGCLGNRKISCSVFLVFLFRSNSGSENKKYKVMCMCIN